MNRCLCCGSTEITLVRHYGPTGVCSEDGYQEQREEDMVRCYSCGAIEAEPAEWPELDALDDMLAYHAEAPLPEPPGDLLPRRMPTAGLTPREVELMTLVAQALSNKMIGATLGTTEQTVKNQLNGIYRKLGIHSRTELMLFARERAVGVAA